MSNAANRPSVVKQDLANVIHPIVPHKQLEEQQLVIVSAKDSTVVDADGREYLDGMAGLWCVNIGYGRTELAGVKPDIVTVAKGISSAYLPMAATVVRNTVFQSFLGDPSENRQVNQVNTYGGHPVAAAVALRNIEIMLEEKLAQRSAENGAYLLDGLKALMRHKWVGDVRGKGLYAGVELVTDRASKAVMPAPQIKRLVERCQERGVIVGRSGGGRHLGNTLVLAPPLVLTRAEIDRIVSVLDQTIPEICPEAAA